MRIWVLLSWYEQLPLFTVLSTLDHEYELFVDWKFQPRSEKSEALVNERVREWVDYLLNTVWVEKCITLSNQKNAQSLIEKAISEYTLTANQSVIRTFHTPFAFWGKTVRMRSHFLTSYSKSDRMVRKTIKTDIRYFRDANVDTIIPTCWSHIYYEKILTHQLNRKKIKFHWLSRGWTTDLQKVLV